MQQSFLSFHPPPTQGIKYIGSKLKTHLASPRTRQKSQCQNNSRRLRRHNPRLTSTRKTRFIPSSAMMLPRGQKSSAPATSSTRNRETHINPSLTTSTPCSLLTAGSQNTTADTPTRATAVQADGLKKPWQLHNTRKLDAIRQEIEHLSLDPVDKSVALTSLILALDRVDNSLGHFSAYLKEWAPRSYKALVLEVPQVFTSEGDHQVYQSDIFELVPRVSVDLAYFDPPYGSNNEKMPASRVRVRPPTTISGKALSFSINPPFSAKQNGERIHQIRSPPLYLRNSAATMRGISSPLKPSQSLIRETQARWILLSYSSGGRAICPAIERSHARQRKTADCP